MIFVVGSFAYLYYEEEIAGGEYRGPSTAGKPRLVILGTGWGATSLLKTIDPGLYDVVVVSPTNYFVFTPLLAGATTGTHGALSVIESTRRLCRRVGGRSMLLLLLGASERLHATTRIHPSRVYTFTLF